MKKFLLKVFLFFAVMAVVDKGLGLLLASATKGLELEKEETGKRNHMADGCHEEVLIFGSSRAEHHYDPRVIMDSLGLSCYNCGQSAMGVIHNYPLLSMIMERSSPKVIIYDVNPYLDFISRGANYSFLRGLKPYYHRNGVREVMDDIDRNERFKTWSSLYSFNSCLPTGCLLSLLNKYLHLTGNTDAENVEWYNGFIELRKQFDAKKVEVGDARDDAHNHKTDALRMKYLRKFIEASENAKLIFCISPRWRGLDGWYVEFVKGICAEYQIPFIDFSNNSKYVHNNDYFYDGTHLNARGADEFTRDLMTEVRRRGLLNDI